MVKNKSFMSHQWKEEIIVLLDSLKPKVPMYYLKKVKTEQIHPTYCTKDLEPTIKQPHKEI